MVAEKSLVNGRDLRYHSMVQHLDEVADAVAQKFIGSHPAIFGVTFHADVNGIEHSYVEIRVVVGFSNPGRVLSRNELPEGVHYLDRIDDVRVLYKPSFPADSINGRH